MRAVVLLLFAAVSMAQHAPAAAEEQVSLLGFSAAAAARQQALETQFDALIDPAEISAWAEDLSRHPHHPGSVYARQNAEYLAQRFRAWGFETEIATYEILLPTPLTRELEMLAPQKFVASLMEDPVPGDDSTAQVEQLLPPYNAFSRDGEAEAELVFVNYGIPEDYETLARYGVDVEGKIVIAKYGKSWRGIKPKLAAEHGAIATLIYSDPAGSE